MPAKPKKIDNTEKYGQAGYPAVEKLIETEDFDAINLAFEDAYAQLHDISKKKRGFGTQRDIKRAMRSLELTLELFRELLALKYHLQEKMEKEQVKWSVIASKASKVNKASKEKQNLAGFSRFAGIACKITSC